MNSSRNRSEGHRKRLRDKFLETGLSGFADYEVIELLLTLATPRKDCKETAKAVLKRFKTIPGVMEAPDSELLEINGIGEINIFGIKLIKAAAQRYLQERLIGKNPINSPEELFDYLYFNLRHKDREYFLAIYLDIKNNILNTERLSEGSIGISLVYPREVVKAAIKNRAASVIFVHNHPSGNPEPSAKDFDVTKKLISALKLIDIRVLDHIIIGNDRYYSFADNGDIKEQNEDYRKMDKPYCYGDIEKVFPKKEDGLRHTPDACFYCSFRIECMKKAVSEGEGSFRLKEEMIDKAYKSGKLSFLQRWSRRKALYKENSK